MKYILILICICLTRFQTFKIMLKINTKSVEQTENASSRVETLKPQRRVFSLLRLPSGSINIAQNTARIPREIPPFIFLCREKFYLKKYTW